MLADILTKALKPHKTTVSTELVNCDCGWYVKRGEGAQDAMSLHFAEVCADALQDERMNIPLAIRVLKSIRDDSTTPMNTAADIDQVLVELLGVRDEDGA